MKVVFFQHLSLSLKTYRAILIYCLLILLSSELSAANSEFKSINKVIHNNSTKIKSHRFAEKLLQSMQNNFLQSEFSQVITSANKVLEIGDDEQQQQALEMLGVARERQGKFAQSISIYNEFLLRYPKSKLKEKVNNRLIGLKTMRLEPKKRLSKYKSKRNDHSWTTFGSFSQYYRKDVINEEALGTQTQNSSLLSDVNVFARKNTAHSRIELRFDAGINNDLLEDASENRVSRATISYHDKIANYKVVSGRQSRTAKGVFGRYDGIVLTQYNDSINYSIFTGSPVLSSRDSMNTNSQFIGGSINFRFLDNITTDIYLVQQDIDGLTGRQAIGSEVQYINDKGFFFGILDYDIFYSDLNNLTLISNYRYDEQWSFNVTFDYRNAPFLTTLNALQGQGVETIEELKASFSSNDIYSLAQDRTSKSTNLFFSSNYQIDTGKQINVSISLNSTKATKSSSAVLATPTSNNLYLSTDYTLKNYFDLNDYTTIGARLSQSTTSETFSIHTRTQFYDDQKIRYQPRFNIDYRLNKNTDLKQWILKPSLKINYKLNKTISFEGKLGFEFSDFNLPDQDKQSSYSVFVGYLYQFD
jgi:hypothetical protein